MLDYWWPEDAPNCFKKELRRVKQSNLANDTADAFSGDATIKKVPEMPRYDTEAANKEQPENEANTE